MKRTKKISAEPLIADRITAYLATVEGATAAQIAQAVGEADYPSRVSSALNAMRTDALIECEKRKKGKGNEMWYWLTHTRATTAQPRPAEGEITGSSASAVTSTTPPAEGAAVHQPAPEVAVDAAAPAAEDVQQDLDDIVVAEIYLDSLDRIAHVLRGCGLPALAGVRGDDDLQQATAALSGAHRVAVAEIAGLRADVAILQTRLDDALLHREDCLRWEQKMMAAIGEDGVNSVVGAIAELQHQLRMAEADLFRERQLRTAGYLVRAPKRRPRIITQQETAITAALAAARGTGRGDVYALVHVGTARRDAVYREAQ